MSKYNWATIQEYYDEGHTFRQLTEKFGCANKTITRAVRNGLLRSRDKNDRSHKSNGKCATCSGPLPISRHKFCSTECHQSKSSPHYKWVKDWRRNTKQKLVQCFGGQCGACGLVDHPVVYDFHHLVEADKEFTLSQQIRSWAKVSEEAKKCVMLCAPCHRKHHVGIDIIPEDVQRFDESLVVPAGIEPA